MAMEPNNVNGAKVLSKMKEMVGNYQANTGKTPAQAGLAWTMDPYTWVALCNQDSAYVDDDDRRAFDMDVFRGVEIPQGMVFTVMPQHHDLFKKPGKGAGPSLIYASGGGSTTTVTGAGAGGGMSSPQMINVKGKAWEYKTTKEYLSYKYPNLEEDDDGNLCVLVNDLKATWKKNSSGKYALWDVTEFVATPKYWVLKTTKGEYFPVPYDTLDKAVTFATDVDYNKPWIVKCDVKPENGSIPPEADVVWKYDAPHSLTGASLEEMWAEWTAHFVGDKGTPGLKEKWSKNPQGYIENMMTQGWNSDHHSSFLKAFYLKHFGKELGKPSLVEEVMAKMAEVDKKAHFVAVQAATEYGNVIHIGPHVTGGPDHKPYKKMSFEEFEKALATSLVKAKTGGTNAPYVSGIQAVYDKWFGVEPKKIDFTGYQPPGVYAVAEPGPQLASMDADEQLKWNKVFEASGAQTVVWQGDDTVVVTTKQGSKDGVQQFSGMPFEVHHLLIMWYEANKWPKALHDFHKTCYPKANMAKNTGKNYWVLNPAATKKFNEKIYFPYPYVSLDEALNLELSKEKEVFVGDWGQDPYSVNLPMIHPEKSPDLDEDIFVDVKDAAIQDLGAMPWIPLGAVQDAPVGLYQLQPTTWASMPPEVIPEVKEKILSDLKAATPSSPFDTGKYPMTLICENCGMKWGVHKGPKCPKGNTTFKKPKWYKKPKVAS